MSDYVNLPHWNYFRLLERDLEECLRYVAPVEAHFGVYSDRFAQIILLAASEIENAFGTWSTAKGEARPKGIVQCRAFALSAYPAFRSMKVAVPRFSLTIQPWLKWSETEAPEWWTAGYNKLKHDRLGYPGAPSLHRALSAVGALLVVLLHFYTSVHGQQFVMPMELAPSLLATFESAGGINGGYIGWSWELPRGDV